MVSGWFEAQSCSQSVVVPGHVWFKDDISDHQTFFQKPFSSTMWAAVSFSQTGFTVDRDAGVLAVSSLWRCHGPGSWIKFCFGRFISLKV